MEHQTAVSKIQDLPPDILTSILMRVHEPFAINLMCMIKDKNIQSAACNDSLWKEIFATIWGEGLLKEVCTDLENSVQSQHIVQIANGERQSCPTWLVRFSRIGGDDIFRQGCHVWEQSPSIRTAFSVLERIAQADFNQNSNEWITEIVRGNQSDEQKAKVIVNFFFWRIRQSVDAGHLEKTKEIISMYITKSKRDSEFGSLALHVRRCYMSRFNMRGLGLVEALGNFLSQIRMPTGASKICMMLWDFSGEFATQNGGSRGVLDEPSKGAVSEGGKGGPWVSHDAVYILTWSLLVLNADAHNPQVKPKMREKDWVVNTCSALHGVGCYLEAEEDVQGYGSGHGPDPLPAPLSPTRSIEGGQDSDGRPQRWQLDVRTMRLMYRQVQNRPLISKKDDSPITAMPAFLQGIYDWWSAMKTQMPVLRRLQGAWRA